MATQLRSFAEQVLFGKTLEEKLSFTRDEIVDTEPGAPIKTPGELSRPPELILRDSASRSNSHPKVSKLVDERERGRLLHFFGNHELLATELMALALLKFPDAPASFRRGVFETLKEEQTHTKLYIHRMKQCGIEFGELPLSDYFWKSVSTMEDPLDYVTRLSLTFEQANLDYSREYKSIFEQVGDDATATILDKIYRDEIEHVGFGLKWFRKWKANGKSDWETFKERLTFPLSPARAKGNHFNSKGRLDAGLDESFVEDLQLFNQSRGRTPSIFWFNPEAELSAAVNAPAPFEKRLETLRQDLEFLPAYLARKGDILIVSRTPSPDFLHHLQNLHFTVPEIIERDRDAKVLTAPPIDRKIGALKPWAWSPDSIRFFEEAAAKLTRPIDLSALWSKERQKLYSKSWSAQWARELAELNSKSDWLAPPEAYGVELNSIDGIESHRGRLQGLGYGDIVIKAPFGTAANGMRCVMEGETLSKSIRAWIEDTMRQQGSVIVEPWLDRVFDYSIQCEAQPNEIKPIAYTRLLNNARGQFRGIYLHRFDKNAPQEIIRFLMTPANGRPRLYDYVENALLPSLRGALSNASFQGPLSIDAFVYRSPGGFLKLKPIVELNPRVTMGRVASEVGRRMSTASFGLFEIVSLSRLKRSNVSSFADYLDTLSDETPRMEGDRIVCGSIAFGEPRFAESFLPMLHVRRSSEEFESLIG